MKEFDPYHEWLGIPPKDQPPHHYRLLGLDLFEADPAIIERAADRQRNYVKQFQAGPKGPMSQRLLNELSKATVCLLNGDAKTSYDEQLRLSLQPPEPAKPQPAPESPMPVQLPPQLVLVPRMQLLPAPVMMPAAPLRPLPLPPHLLSAQSAPTPPPAPPPSTEPELPRSIRVAKPSRRSPSSAPLLLLAGGAGLASIVLIIVSQASKTEPTPPPKKLAGAHSSAPTFPSKPQPRSPKRETAPAVKPAPLATKPPPEATPKTTPEASATPRIKTLIEARAEYHREKSQFSQAVSAELAKREAAAQKSEDAEAIKQTKEVREALAKGMIPKDAPGKDLIELMAAREELAKLLQREIVEAKEKPDEPQVAALQQELTDFMIGESADIGDVNWRFPECTFRLINVATGLALAAHNEGNGAAVIQAKEDPADPLQHWFVRFPGQWFSRVRLRKNGRNLNVPASDRASGRHIILWHEEHQSNGYWELQYRGSYYHVRSHFSGKLLSVPNATKKEGQHLIQWDHHDSPDDQKWKLIRVLPDPEPE